MKYLIVGLGNKGEEYQHTRHNVGFEILDNLAKNKEILFVEKRYGWNAEYKYKGRKFVLLKPNTYVNLSGKAVNYWLQKEKISLQNLLVVVDDIALPFGKIRMRKKGSDAGHNGLKNINEILGTTNYARLRFGIGSEYSKGRQVDYVLGKWTDKEQEQLPILINKAIEGILNFGTLGIDRTMNILN